MLSLMEILDIAVMTLFVGFIFKDSFFPKGNYTEPLEYFGKKRKWHQSPFGSAVLVTAPGIVLHEFGHKFLALSFGMTAEFHAAYMWLLIGVVLKLMNFGFIFFVPAYVSIAGQGSALQFSLVSFAGPAVNLLIWLGAWLFLKYGKPSRKHLPYIVLTKKINMFLFLFNMLPIPPFDGFGVFSNLYHAFF